MPYPVCVSLCVCVCVCMCLHHRESSGPRGRGLNGGGQQTRSHASEAPEIECPTLPAQLEEGASRLSLSPSQPGGLRSCTNSLLGCGSGSSYCQQAVARRSRRYEVATSAARVRHCLALWPVKHTAAIAGARDGDAHSNSRGRRACLIQAAELLPCQAVVGIIEVHKAREVPDLKHC